MGTSAYPATLDAFTTTHSDTTEELVHANDINAIADAVNKIEAHHGTQPKGIALPAYSTSITPNAGAGTWQTITVGNGTAFTINAPTNPPDATHTRELVIELFNNSGGAMGAVTWNSAFVFTGGAVTNPLSTKKRYVKFQWNGTKWVEQGRAAADY